MSVDRSFVLQGKHANCAILLTKDSKDNENMTMTVPCDIFNVTTQLLVARKSNRVLEIHVHMRLPEEHAELLYEL